METPHHGGVKIKEIKKYGFEPDDVIDFSASLNPFGPPRFIKKLFKDIDIDEISRYPSSTAEKARKTIANDLGVFDKNVVVTAGISELIDLIGKTFISSDNKVLIPKYTYGEYVPVGKINGADLDYIDMPGLELNKSKIIQKIERGSVLFLCNPNNPTGDFLSYSEIKEILSEIKDLNSLLIVDEAYIDFLNNNRDLKSLLCENIVLMRSFTKSFGVPGIRIGYGLSDSNNVKNLMKTKIPWNVSTLSQKAVIELKSRKGKNFLDSSKEKIIKNRKKFSKELKKLGYDFKKSKTNFLLIRVGDAGKIRKKLLKKGLIVRDCSSFGLPQFIRVGIRKKNENKKLLSELKKLK